MGCIESRSPGNSESQSLKPKFLEILPAPEAAKDQDSEVLSDARGNDIEEYGNNLIYNANWANCIEKPGISVKTKMGSVFNSNIPVTLAFVEFDELIPTKFIMDMLYNPIMRMKWDDTVLEMSLVSKVSENLSIIRLVKKFPFISREFLFKVYIRNHVYESSVSAYSIKSSQIQTSSKYERGEVMFAFTKIMPRSNHTAIVLMQQIDNKLPQKPELANVEFCQWANLFRTKLQKIREADPESQGKVKVDN